MNPVKKEWKFRLTNVDSKKRDHDSFIMVPF